MASLGQHYGFKKPISKDWEKVKARKRKISTKRKGRNR